MSLLKNAALIFLIRKHVVNIVTLSSGATYAVDVAFGGDGPTQPLLLSDGYTIRNLGTQEVRLIHDYIPEQLSRLPHQKLWMYQYRSNPSLSWNPFYALAETEFFPPDFGGMNFDLSQKEDSYQRLIVLCIKFLKKEESISGKLMLVDSVLKINTGGKTKVIATFDTEEQRVQALQDHFAIILNREEIDGIKGLYTELPMTIHKIGK